MVQWRKACVFALALAACVFGLALAHSHGDWLTGWTAPDNWRRLAAQASDEKEPFDDHTKGVSAVLIGLPFLNSLILCMVNARDPDLRSYSWKMISSTLAIFIAVLVYKTADAIIWKQVLLGGKDGPGLNLEKYIDEYDHMTQVAVSGICLLLCLVGISAVCFWLKDQHDKLHAVGDISGHITGFVGLGCFGHLQHSIFIPDASRHVNVVLAMVGGGVFVAFIGFLGPFLRDKCQCSEVRRPTDNESQSPLMDEEQSSEASKTEEEEEEEESKSLWCEVATEAEDEASGLFYGFLTSQFLLLLLNGRLSPIKFEEGENKKTRDEIFRVFLAYMVCFGIFIALKLIGDKCKPTRRRSIRVMHWVQTWVIMTSAFLGLRVVSWMVERILGVNIMAQIVSACAATMYAVALTLALDMVADNLGEARRAVRERSPPTSPTHTERPIVPFDYDAVIQSSAESAEMAVRVLIAGQGVVVGICWEKAFEVAYKVIAFGIEPLNKHPVVVKSVIGFLTLLVIGPAWLLYVIPIARKDRDEHMESIEKKDREQAIAKHQPLSDNQVTALAKETCRMIELAMKQGPESQKQLIEHMERNKELNHMLLDTLQ